MVEPRAEGPEVKKPTMSRNQKQHFPARQPTLKFRVMPVFLIRARWGEWWRQALWCLRYLYRVWMPHYKTKWQLFVFNSSTMNTGSIFSNDEEIMCMLKYFLTCLNGHVILRRCLCLRNLLLYIYMHILSIKISVPEVHGKKLNMPATVKFCTQCVGRFRLYLRMYLLMWPKWKYFYNVYLKLMK